MNCIIQFQLDLKTDFFWYAFDQSTISACGYIITSQYFIQM